MPLVRISVFDQLAAERRKQVPRAVYDAMRAAIGIPEGDLFVLLTAHPEDELVVDPAFMGMRRTRDFVLVHITLRRGRATELKQKLYREITSLLAQRAGIQPDDVMIVLAENDSSDWSFGQGVAQYVPAQGSGAK
jgi:phenylpyruvate tautomerase PptA (4-oxalocrotonate tautomerase family)